MARLHHLEWYQEMFLSSFNFIQKNFNITGLNSGKTWPQKHAKVLQISHLRVRSGLANWNCDRIKKRTVSGGLFGAFYQSSARFFLQWMMKSQYGLKRPSFPLLPCLFFGFVVVGPSTIATSSVESLHERIWPSSPHVKVTAGFCGWISGLHIMLFERRDHNTMSEWEIYLSVRNVDIAYDFAPMSSWNPYFVFYIWDPV